MPHPVLSINAPATKDSVSHLLVFGLWQSPTKLFQSLAFLLALPYPRALARSLDPLRASKVEGPLGHGGILPPPVDPGAHLEPNDALARLHGGVVKVPLLLF